MTLHVNQEKFNLPDGSEVVIETGKLARQANGAVTVRYKNCILLATVVANKEAKEGQGFFPLSVDYQEKYASAGRIPGSFFKRESKLSDYEILISRLIDRALRPLFPEDYLCEVQVLINLISSDETVMPDALACLAASAALAVSDIPIKEMISEVRVSKIDGKIIINPSKQDLKNAHYDFIVAATQTNVMMVEGEAKECSEDELIEAIAVAHEAIKVQIKAQELLRNKLGLTQKRTYNKPLEDETIKNQVHDFAAKKIEEISLQATAKEQRTELYNQLKEACITHLKSLHESESPETKDSTDMKPLSQTDITNLTKKYFEDLKWTVVRNVVIDHKIRLDGRKTNEIRPLYIETDILPSPHGSALFTRGETQSLTTITLGTKLDELMIETAAEANYSRLILHYNFPPFSTGEVKMMRGPGRREVGHGNLALRSIKQVIPLDSFPYTLRIVSDILESNGSSSMATVCASSLALMDAGVPIKEHVSGIAMGLISREDGKYAILSDILGDEDHLGDMDFKVTGTQHGICGVQMDIKVDGLSKEILTEALAQAKEGRLHILKAMQHNIQAPRPDLKPHAPRMEKIIIDKEFIGAVIGPGGKIIQEMQRTTGATITIEEINNRGEVSIFAKEKTALDAALNKIKGIIAVPEVGKIYDGIVKGIKEFGAFVEILPGKQGLLHISEIQWERLETMDGIFKEGDKVTVKLLDIDKTGKYKLSKKILTPKK
ncbi:MAG: polyribonucleotide nucleotidyltransferase [Alphaproteobacteria bacterium]|nr:polyribonucleotide nucleotidyltransferase [Alphaproteobacteria bacterium]